MQTKYKSSLERIRADNITPVPATFFQSPKTPARLNTPSPLLNENILSQNNGTTLTYEAMSSRK